MARKTYEPTEFTNDCGSGALPTMQRSIQRAVTSGIFDSGRAGSACAATLSCRSFTTPHTRCINQANLLPDTLRVGVNPPSVPCISSARPPISAKNFASAADVLRVWKRSTGSAASSAKGVASLASVCGAVARAPCANASPAFFQRWAKCADRNVNRLMAINRAGPDPREASPGYPSSSKSFPHVTHAGRIVNHAVDDDRKPENACKRDGKRKGQVCLFTRPGIAGDHQWASKFGNRRSRLIVCACVAS